ncbi:type IV secretory system conjugative DNA transfer family protein [Nonomuraea sp. NPDC050663]|uniref:type IV secretory system conjugative DNA transfer family protein n=1 Tax=Nonomuraea sp. NPDC050663 TaxID=3364370 RepID=UPI0037948126
MTPDTPSMVAGTTAPDAGQISMDLLATYGPWFAVLFMALALAAVTVSRIQDPQKLRGLSLWFRLRWRLYPGPGFARRLELWRHYGRPAAQKAALRARPSLGSRWRRPLLHHKEIAIFLGWAQGWIVRMRVYATLEDTVLVLAPPKEYKSAWLAGRIIDAPGSVVATSIRTDLAEATAGLRSRRGLVNVLNPEGVGHLASTTRVSLVRGCEDQQTALRRAARIVSASQTGGMSDEGFWVGQAAMVLSAMLHAAALAGLELPVVYGWIVSDDPAPANILRVRRPGLNTELPAAIVSRYLATHARTRDSVAMTLRQALRFLEDPAIAWMLSPDPGEAGLDFARFLRGKGTLYLVAGEEVSVTAPLFSCLLGELHFYAHLFGSRQPYGRLDPPVLFALDEFTNFCRVKELPGWLSTAAGSGMAFVLAAQSYSQLVQQWGEHGARTIWNSSKAKVFFGGTSNPDDLERVSVLCDEITLFRWEASIDDDGRRRRSRRAETVRVLPLAQVRMLPVTRAVVIRRNVRPTIVRAELVWQRADVKRRNRSGAPMPLPRLESGGAASFATTGAGVGAGGGAVDNVAARRRLRDRLRPRPARPWDASQDASEDGSA